MAISFESDFFKANRQRLRSLFSGTAPVVIAGHGLLQRNSDSHYPFRQDSSFWYLTGIDEADCLLVMDKVKEYLIVNKRSAERSYFDGQIETEKFAAISGISEIFDQEDGWRQLSIRLKKVKHLATLAPPPTYIDKLGIYANPARKQLVDQVKQVNPGIELLDLRPHLLKQRSIKQPLEIKAIKQAINITAKALKLAKKRLNKAENEHLLEGLITNEFIRQGSRHAYQPIVAAGLNACTLHYNSNNSAISPGQAVVFDVGAEVNNYAADLTRTFVSGRPSKRVRQVHAAVKGVQEYAQSLLKPGLILAEYETLVRQFMGEKLRSLGLIKTIDKEAVARFYPHSTSHFLGLDVHDVGDYQEPLQAGMVLTVEPGIYSREEAIGVRIEDDILITATGALNLSRNLSSSL